MRFLARPVSGGHFALLALDAADAANRERRGQKVNVEADGTLEPFVVQGDAFRTGFKWERET